MEPIGNREPRCVADIINETELSEAAEKAEKDAMETRKILLGCGLILQANSDFLSFDLLSVLEDEMGRIEREISEDEKGRIESEASEDVSGGEDRFFKSQLQGLADHLSVYTVSRRKEIIERYQAEVLPGLLAEERNEEARDTARDELLDLVSEFSYEKQTDYYRLILEGTKDMAVQLA